LRIAAPPCTNCCRSGDESTKRGHIISLLLSRLLDFEVHCVCAQPNSRFVLDFQVDSVFSGSEIIQNRQIKNFDICPARRYPFIWLFSWYIEWKIWWSSRCERRHPRLPAKLTMAVR